MRWVARQFSSHYDLLASECRLTSLVAIAKGDLPAEHWFAMSRPYVYYSRQTLLSWSGTMFEYLMPLLFMRTYTNSLLDHACRDAVDRQIATEMITGFPGVFPSPPSARSIRTRSISIEPSACLPSH